MLLTRLESHVFYHNVHETLTCSSASLGSLTLIFCVLFAFSCGYVFFLEMKIYGDLWKVMTASFHERTNDAFLLSRTFFFHETQILVSLGKRTVSCAFFPSKVSVFSREQARGIHLCNCSRFGWLSYDRPCTDWFVSNIQGQQLILWYRIKKI